MSRPPKPSMYVIAVSEDVTVRCNERDGNGAWYDVRIGDGRIKTFYGECAWSDSQRYANDWLPYHAAVNY